MRIAKRLAVAVVSVAIGSAAPAHAQAPAGGTTRPITLVVPLPQVPTVSENALAGFNVGVWFGIAAPAKTARDVTDRIGKEIGEITRLPDLQKKLSPLGYDLGFAGADRFRELIATDHKRYGSAANPLAASLARNSASP